MFQTTSQYIYIYIYHISSWYQVGNIMLYPFFKVGVGSFDGDVSRGIPGCLHGKWLDYDNSLTHSGMIPRI